MRNTTKLINEVVSDDLYKEIIEFIINQEEVSVSSIQRRYLLGYNRASKILEILESRGIIESSKGSSSRRVLIKPDEYKLKNNG